MTVGEKQLGLGPHLILSAVQPQLVDRAVDSIPPGDQLGCADIKTDALRDDRAPAHGAVDWILGQRVGQVRGRELTATAALIIWSWCAWSEPGVRVAMLQKWHIDRLGRLVLRGPSIEVIAMVNGRGVTALVFPKSLARQ